MGIPHGRGQSWVEATIVGDVDVDRPCGRSTIMVKNTIVEQRADMDKPRGQKTIVD